MELKTFCEICSNKNTCGIDSETCRLCATAWKGKGAPPAYKTSNETLRSVLEEREASEHIRVKDVLQDKFKNLSISAYRQYTKDSLAFRVKILNAIIAFAEAELNHIAEEDHQ